MKVDAWPDTYICISVISRYTLAFKRYPAIDVHVTYNAYIVGQYLLFSANGIRRYRVANLRRNCAKLDSGIAPA